MRTVRRLRRLSTHTLPDSLDQCLPGGFDYLHVERPEPPIGQNVTAATVSYDAPLSPQAIELLSAFADQRELPPPDLHSQCRRRKGKNGGVPRPPNAFMLFRSDFWKFNKGTIPERDHRQISRIAAHCWNALAGPRRVPYQDQAKKLKEEHAQMYPQHKYNPSKDKSRKKVKEEIDDDELCGVLAAQVAKTVGTPSKSPKVSGFGEIGFLDQVMELKVNSKRSHSASVTFGVEGASKDGSLPSNSPAKKCKRAHNPSTHAVQQSKAQSQADLFHSSILPFSPTDEIPFLSLPPSRQSPVVKGEPLQDQSLGITMRSVTVKNEPALSPQLVVEPQKIEAAELEVPDVSELFSPQFPPTGFEPPVQYFEKTADTVVDRGLQIFENYGIVGFFEGLDLSIFDHLGDASASMGMPEENDEFARWCLNPC